MTKEEQERSLAMMEQMKQRMSGQSAQQPGPQGGQKPGPGPQGGQQARPSQAEQLKTSLEGIKESALYLMNSKFVK
jgi:hypothetical protein